MGRFTRFAALVCALGVLILMPAAASAQQASLTGVVRDTSGAVLPGVTVEARSPALIEKARSTVTDGNGQYRILNLPVGTYTVTFSLPGFRTQRVENVQLTTGFTATINGELSVGGVEETIIVVDEVPTVDVQNPEQRRIVEGDTIRELPSPRDASSLMTMVAGLNGGAGNNVGGTQGPILVGFSAHGGNTQEGRLQVDGMSAGAAIGGAGVSGYIADVANAQEVSFTLAGSLGEAEVGGGILNIVPRTGGNRYSGSFFASFADDRLVDRNNETHTSVRNPSSLRSDHDVNVSLGGPLVRDRLWYYLIGRHRGNSNNVANLWHNANEGIFGANYAPDFSRPNVSEGTWKNASARVTWQVSDRHKIDLFWDEQDWCTPCNAGGANFGGFMTSPEANTSASVGPNRVQQLSWTNPFSNRLLFDAGLSVLSQKWGLWESFGATNHRNIPRVTELGGIPCTMAQPGEPCNPGTAITSGSQSWWDADAGNANLRASASYIRGSHTFKVGYQGAFLSEWDAFFENDTRLAYTYLSLAAPGAPPSPAVPVSFTQYARPRIYDERAGFSAVYVQDQWTMDRVTLSGALRYDYSWSSFPEQIVGQDRFIPESFSFPETDGVSLHELQPRWGVTWDLFGNGRTALRWNMGRYVQPTTIGGRYNAVNPLRRAPESLTRGWIDDGDRVVECDFFNPAAHSAGGDTCLEEGDVVQFGRDPRITGVGFTTTYCGQEDPGVDPRVLAFCESADQDLINGWRKRTNDWQFGIGIQHEVLPRVSAEVSYNRRWYSNFEMLDNLNLTGADFVPFSVIVPDDPALPAQIRGQTLGGFYDITPEAQARPTLNVVTLTDARDEYWHGVDVAINVRAFRNLRLQGSTSTGRLVTDTCATLVDRPNPTSGAGAFGTQQQEQTCHTAYPFQTNVRALAAYTIPRVDVLVSGVYQYKPGPELSATITASAANTTPALGPGRTATVNLLRPGQLYGDSVSQLDLKVAKVFRFAGTRANVGLDIYNLFNSDAVTTYTTAYAPDTWLTPTALLHPRFARFSLQIDF